MFAHWRKSSWLDPRYCGSLWPGDLQDSVLRLAASLGWLGRLYGRPAPDKSLAELAGLDHGVGLQHCEDIVLRNKGESHCRNEVLKM